MPIYVYKAKNKNKSCRYCAQGFELLQRIGDKPLARCPECKAPVKKDVTVFSGGYSKTGFDRKAKEGGFHKLRKVDKGKYEKLY